MTATTPHLTVSASQRRGKKDRLPNVDSRGRMNNSSALRSRSSSQESHGEGSRSVTLTSQKQMRNNVSPPRSRSSSQQSRGGRDRSVTSRGPQRCCQTQSSQLSARKISSGTGSVQQQPSICSSSQQSYGHGDRSMNLTPKDQSSNLSSSPLFKTPTNRSSQHLQVSGNSAEDSAQLRLGESNCSERLCNY